MEKFPTAGIPSSERANSTVDVEAALVYLKSISSSGDFLKFSSALGADSKLHIVGGTVRDSLFGIKASDLDCSSVLEPTEVTEKLEKAGIKVVETGIRHGTVTALCGEYTIELTTFRQPGPREGAEYSDNIETDLSGRDFTINAIAYDCFEHKLIDPLDGVAALKTAKVSAVGDAKERFEEDPQRLLRMVRFGPASGREIDEECLSATTELAETLNRISIERVRDEFVNILMSEYPAEGVKALYELGLLEIILPEAIPSVGFEQNKFHIHDVFEHTLWVISRAVEKEQIRLASLFHDLGKPQSLTVSEDGERHFYRHEEISADISRQVMKRMKFSNEMTNQVTKLVRHHMRPIECGPAGCRRLIRDLGEDLTLWKELKRADKQVLLTDEEFDKRMAEFDALISAEEQKELARLRSGLCVNGEDLEQLGIQEGPKMGEILSELEELILDDPSLNARDLLLEKAAKIAVEKGLSLKENE